MLLLCFPPTFELKQEPQLAGFMREDGRRGKEI